MGACKALRNGTNCASNSRGADCSGSGKVGIGLPEAPGGARRRIGKGLEQRLHTQQRRCYVRNNWIYRLTRRDTPPPRGSAQNGISWLRLGGSRRNEREGRRNEESGGEDLRA